jgi:DNA-binding transcriptional regulator YiaG
VKVALLRERKFVAALRTRVLDQGDQIERLQARMRAVGSPRPEVSEATLQKRRWRKDRVRAIRVSLGLSQADFAQLVGVSANAVYQWESGRSSPQAKYRTVMLGLRGVGKRDARRLLSA